MTNINNNINASAAPQISAQNFSGSHLFSVNSNYIDTKIKNIPNLKEGPQSFAATGTRQFDPTTANIPEIPINRKLLQGGPETTAPAKAEAQPIPSPVKYKNSFVEGYLANLVFNKVAVGV